MIKQLLIQWLLKEERPRIFALAQKDILETMDDDLEKRAEELSQRKLAKLLSIVNEEDIITLKGRTIYLGGEPATDQQVANLKAEAEFFISSELWKVINETPKKLAQLAMFIDDGKIENQLLKGRAILYTLSTQQKVIDVLKNLSPT